MANLSITLRNHHSCRNIYTEHKRRFTIRSCQPLVNKVSQLTLTLMLISSVGISDDQTRFSSQLATVLLKSVFPGYWNVSSLLSYNVVSRNALRRCS